jgi:hypothetical protein
MSRCNHIVLLQLPEQIFTHIYNKKMLHYYFKDIISKFSLSQWPRGLRRGSAAIRLLRPWVRIPPGAWMFFCWECCVLSGRGLCDELITRPEKSYQMWRVVVCDLETSRMRRPWPALGRSATGKKNLKYTNELSNLLSQGDLHVER